jgi:hypothetical protein
MDATSLGCGDRRGRRAQVRASGFNGVDFVEIDDPEEGDAPDAPPVLCVHFFGNIPDGLTAANVRIEGGRRIRDIEVTAIETRRSTDPEMDDCLRVRLNRAGDLTTYRLCLVEADGAQPLDQPLAQIDRRYRCAAFAFKVDCLDCETAPTCPPSDAGAPPEINYLAKDYQSFRQLLLDRLAFVIPDWKERHAADLGVTLLEVLAYVGDSLSYYQDAVATEAYLDTARQRISVRRHARLVDYAMHEGCNARAFLSLTTDTDVSLAVDDVFFTTGLDPATCSDSGAGRVRTLDELTKEQERPGAVSFESFEAVVPTGQTKILARAAHSEIEIYTWGDSECCLPRGATRATLKDAATGDQRALAFAVGDLMLFEEIVGPETGDPADADPRHRHVVRLTKVVQDVDPLYKQPIVEIAWDPRDALPFPLCVSARLGAPACKLLSRLVVARGNIIVVDHGRTATPDAPLGAVGVLGSEGSCACDGLLVEITETPAPFRPTLPGGPVTFRAPNPSNRAPATELLAQDPRQALPALSLFETPSGNTWTPQPHLLDSGPDDDHFVVEIDDERRPHLRFGDGLLGRRPPARAAFAAHYRVGSGPSGNVGRDTITEIVLRTTTLSGVALRARNPLPAAGGTDPEPVELVKQLAPNAFRQALRRAVTAADYATLAAAPDGVPSTAIQGAVAELQWTGSWYEAHVAVDPIGGEAASPALLASVQVGLEPFRRIGHDLRVVGARYVPLDIALDLCVLPDYVRRDVVAAVVEAFGSRRLANGTLGFFHPDNLRFERSVFLSQVVATAQAVPGVRSVDVTTFKRLFEPAGDEKAKGVIALRFSELAQLDNDRNDTETGRLTIHAGGGR